MCKGVKIKIKRNFYFYKSNQENIYSVANTLASLFKATANLRDENTNRIKRNMKKKTQHSSNMLDSNKFLREVIIYIFKNECKN